ncbi:molybdopterin molybdotransferase MoeA [Niabella terrae]
MEQMISVITAKELISRAIARLPPVRLSLAEAAGKILAEPVYAQQDIPGFPQSAMDGYAFSFPQWKKDRGLHVAGELPAGAGKSQILQAGEAFRIFTGAPVPEGADTVVMQEKVEVAGPSLTIRDPQIQLGANVRPQGSELRKGQLVLDAGSLLRPAAIGLLAAAGRAAVEVYPLPRISLIVTGSELQTPGQPLSYGQVYESNSLMLAAALETKGFILDRIFHATDNLEELSDTLQQALAASDLLLLTGGVSVGSYDFVLRAAEVCGITPVFHKVRQRPGKPLFFGIKGSKPVFGLPGNPASVLTCFSQYIWLALEQLTGLSLQPASSEAVLENDFEKSHPLTHFLKGSLHAGRVRILEAQESYRLKSFAQANCLVELGPEPGRYTAGSLVKVYQTEGERGQQLI